VPRLEESVFEARTQLTHGGPHGSGQLLPAWVVWWPPVVEGELEERARPAEVFDVGSENHEGTQLVVESTDAVAVLEPQLEQQLDLVAQRVEEEPVGIGLLVGTLGHRPPWHGHPAEQPAFAQPGTQP